jgi:hypothetical protein
VLVWSNQRSLYTSLEYLVVVIDFRLFVFFVMSDGIVVLSRKI